MSKRKGDTGLDSCSFCGRHSGQVDRLIQGPPGTYICNECVDVCSTLIRDQKGEKKSTSGTWRGTVDYSKDFHVYALEWEPDSIRWYIDGQRIHATTTGIPHTPHYLILNTAVGGGWPGNPDTTTTFPQYHDVDYVRVYRRAKDF